MSAEVLPAPVPYRLSTTDHQAGRLGALSLGLIGLFGLALPVMWMVEVAGGQLNTCAADLFILPVLLILRGRLVKVGSLGYWILALWTINVISWAFSASLLDFVMFLRECVKLATCFLYAFAGFAIARDARGSNAFVKGMVWSGIILAAVGIFAFFSRQPAWFLDEGDRVSGTYDDPNAFAIYLSMVLPLAASVGIGWTVIPLFIGAALVSFSRTGLAAMGASVLLNSLTVGLKRFLLVAVAGAFIFLTLYGIAISTTRVGRRVAKYEKSLETRKSLWSLATEVVAEHPAIGIGKGNWEEASGSHILPHNTFLSVMVDGGIIGFAVFIIPIFVWVGRGLRQPAARRWAIVVFVGLVGGLAVSLDNFRPFWLGIGALVAQLAITQPNQTASCAVNAVASIQVDNRWR